MRLFRVRKTSELSYETFGTREHAGEKPDFREQYDERGVKTDGPSSAGGCGSCPHVGVFESIGLAGEGGLDVARGATMFTRVPL